MSTRIARVLVAETGADMSRFPTAAHLASRAGMCPGNHESAGEHHGRATRRGDSWLRGAPGEAACAASRTDHTYLQARCRRLAGRRGKQRALVAVGHGILIATWHMITNGIDYNDLGPDYFLTRNGPGRHTRRLVAQHQQLGFRVTLDPAS